MLSEFKLYSDLTGKDGNLPADQYTFLVISRSVLLRMKNVSQEIIQKMETHILCSTSFFRKSCLL